MNTHLYELENEKHCNYKLQSDYTDYKCLNFSILELVNSNIKEAEQKHINKHNSIVDGYNIINSVHSENDYISNSIIDIDDNCLNLIRQNVNIIRYYKYETVQIKNEQSYYCLNWYVDNYQIVKDQLYNLYVNVFKVRKQKSSWTTFDTYKDLIKSKGNIKAYKGLMDNSKCNSLYLFYMVNLYPPFGYTNKTSEKDRYALNQLINWISVNADINNKFYLYIASNRMRNIFIEWLNKDI